MKFLQSSFCLSSKLRLSGISVLIAGAISIANVATTMELPLVLEPGESGRSGTWRSWSLDLRESTPADLQETIGGISSRLFGELRNRSERGPYQFITDFREDGFFAFYINEVSPRATALDVYLDGAFFHRKWWFGLPPSQWENTLFYLPVQAGTQNIELRVHTSMGQVNIERFYFLNDLIEIPEFYTRKELQQEERHVVGEQNAGYRGIWYRLGHSLKYGDKYSGGLGTYTANHKPLAVYSEAANKTFFVVGGTPSEEEAYLLILAGAYDHDTHQVSRPTIAFNKGSEGVDDPHDNATISLDQDGHVWIFVAGRSRYRDGTLLRSTEPHSVESFEEIKVWQGMNYPQPWFDGESFRFFFTKYTVPRHLYFSSSDNGKDWTEDKPLARFGGHYQVSGLHPASGRIGTFFNYHPDSSVDRRTNVYFMQSTNGGLTWTTVDGKPLETPLTTIQNPALVIDYESQGLLQYTCDLNWDADGNPLLLYVVSPQFAPGPTETPRRFHLTRWTGSEWETSVITETFHNYDMGSIHVEGKRWSVFIPSGKGPQGWGTGGEVEMWSTTDAGRNWSLERVVTQGSHFNQTYVRRSISARDPFFNLWADGDTVQASRSYFYFGNSDGTKVWRLPYTMEEDWETPEKITFDSEK